MDKRTIDGASMGSLADMLGYSGTTAAEKPARRPSGKKQDASAVVTTTVRLRKDQVLALKRAAIDEETTVSALLRDVVDEYLAKQKRR